MVVEAVISLTSVTVVMLVVHSAHPSSHEQRASSNSEPLGFLLAHNIGTPTSYEKQLAQREKQLKFNFVVLYLVGLSPIGIKQSQVTQSFQIAAPPILVRFYGNYFNIRPN